MSEEIEKAVLCRLRLGFYSCTGCYHCSGVVPNVLDEACREKQRARRARLAAPSNGGQAGTQGNHQHNAEATPMGSNIAGVQAGAPGLATPSAAAGQKRGASALDSTSATNDTGRATKKARVVRNATKKTVDPIQRPQNPLRKMRTCGSLQLWGRPVTWRLDRPQR